MYKELKELRPQQLRIKNERATSFPKLCVSLSLSLDLSISRSLDLVPQAKLRENPWNEVDECGCVDCVVERFRSSTSPW